MAKPTVAALWVKLTLPGVGQIGPGKIELLRKIAELQSISGAARAMDMSYRRAWLLVDETNRCLVSPAVETSSGGQRGGGTTLTPVGVELVRRYRALERATAAATLRTFKSLLR